jgi:hypothetical protein
MSNAAGKTRHRPDSSCISQTEKILHVQQGCLRSMAQLHHARGRPLRRSFLIQMPSLHLSPLFWRHSPNITSSFILCSSDQMSSEAIPLVLNTFLFLAGRLKQDARETFTEMTSQPPRREIEGKGASKQF